MPIRVPSRGDMSSVAPKQVECVHSMVSSIPIDSLDNCRRLQDDPLLVKPLLNPACKRTRNFQVVMRPWCTPPRRLKGAVEMAMGTFTAPCDSGGRSRKISSSVSSLCAYPNIFTLASVVGSSIVFPSQHDDGVPHCAACVIGALPQETC